MERKTIGYGAYYAPEISVVEVCIEQGFSLSTLENEGFVLGDGTQFDEEGVMW